MKINQLVLMYVMFLSHLSFTSCHKFGSSLRGYSDSFYEHRLLVLRTKPGQAVDVFLHQFSCNICAQLKKEYIKYFSYQVASCHTMQLLGCGHNLVFWQRFIPCKLYNEKQMLEHLKYHQAYMQKIDQKRGDFLSKKAKCQFLR